MPGAIVNDARPAGEFVGLRPSRTKVVAPEAALTISEWEPWTDHGRTDVPAEWWATPLGRLTWLASANTSGEIGVQEAMSLLRVSRARVYQLLEEGTLKRGRAGGISRRSVARRLEPQG